MIVKTFYFKFYKLYIIIYNVLLRIKINNDKILKYNMQGRGICMRYWQEEEVYDIEQKRQVQSERLIKTVNRVYNNVPFYCDKMKALGLEPGDIKSIDDLSKLPFTTKQDLRDNYPYGLFAAPMEEVVRIHASSGTTGSGTYPCFFWYYRAPDSSRLHSK